MSTQPLVLVADDEPRITKLVSIALGEEGFRVVTANGGEEALQKAEEVRPDIVLLDIVMPDLDGIEVMRQLREQRPVPVILLTAKGATADKAKGLDLGADDYIAKPFHPDELAARVRAVIRRSTGVEPGAGVVAFDDVEEDDVGSDLLGLGQGILAARRGDDAEPLLAQGDGDELRDPGLVVRDEDQGLGSHATPLLAMAGW